MTVLVGKDIFVSELYKKLLADSTLQGATYLNSTTSVYKYRRPSAEADHALLIDADVSVQPDGPRWHTALITVKAFSPNIGKEPDGERLSMNVTRAAIVLETMQPYTGGGIWIHVMRTLGEGGPYLDSQAPEEHWSYVRLRSHFAFT